MTTKPINFNRLTLFEALELINKDTSMLHTYFKFAPNSPLHKVFKCAFLPECKFLLPEGNPPYTPSKEQVGMSSCDLLVAIRKNRFDYFNGTVKLPEIKREQLFINLLETVHPSEAKVLLAIKDQTIDKMFTNITYDVLAEAGYLPIKVVVETIEEKQAIEKEDAEQPSKSKTTRGRKASTTKKTTTRTTRRAHKDKSAPAETAE